MTAPTAMSREAIALPDSGPGWRLLVEDEPILADDEVWSYGRGPWQSINSWPVGHRWSDGTDRRSGWQPMRRKLPLAPQPAPDAFPFTDAQVDEIARVRYEAFMVNFNCEAWPRMSAPEREPHVRAMRAALAKASAILGNLTPEEEARLGARLMRRRQLRQAATNGKAG